MNKGLFSTSNGSTEPDLGEARVWVKFSCISGVVKILSSHNVRDVKRSSTGNYTIFFSRAFLSGDYAITLAVQSNGGTPPFTAHVNQNDAGLNDRKMIITMANGSNGDMPEVHFTAFGRLA